MAKLTVPAFISKWNALFADNSSREISEQDMRDLVQDLMDSCMMVTTYIGYEITPQPFIFCGEVDLSGDAFPETGGTGLDTAIKKGNSFRVSVGTTASGISGAIIDPNSEIIALVDVPGQTLANWWIRI